MVHWGFRLIACGVVASAVFVVLTSILWLSHRDVERWDLFFLVLGSSCILACSSAVGILVGFIGRTSCLDTPSELPVARARIRLAVILEGCGLLSSAVNGGVVWANNTSNITLPVEVLYSVFWFAFALFVAGRAFFYAFTVALAKAVDMKPAPRPSVSVLMMVVTGATIVATAVGLQLTGGSRPLTHTEIPTTAATFVAALGTFGALYAIGRWHHRLREAVTQYNTCPVEHEEG